MQKVIDVLIKTKDDKNHIRHLHLQDIEVDSIIIKENVIEAKKLKEQQANKNKKKGDQKKDDKKDAKKDDKKDDNESKPSKNSK